MGRTARKRRAADDFYILTLRVCREMDAKQRKPPEGGFRVLTLVILHEGIVLRAEFDAKRRPGEVELLAEEALQVAPVAFPDVLQGVPVHDDDGRVRAPLVREAGLRAAAAGARGLLTLDGFDAR